MSVAYRLGGLRPCARSAPFGEKVRRFILINLSNLLVNFRKYILKIALTESYQKHFLRWHTTDNLRPNHTDTTPTPHQHHTNTTTTPHHTTPHHTHTTPTPHFLKKVVVLVWCGHTTPTPQLFSKSVVLVWCGCGLGEGCQLYATVWRPLINYHAFSVVAL